jgi:hypothetical protein
MIIRNNNNIITTNRNKSAASIAVNFKKLKKKCGNEKTLETWTCQSTYEKLEKVIELLSMNNLSPAALNL